MWKVTVVWQEHFQEFAKGGGLVEIDLSMSLSQNLNWNLLAFLSALSQFASEY